MGTVSGDVLIQNYETMKHFKLKYEKQSSVVDLDFNPGENILVVFYEDGQMILFSMETYTAVVKFER